MRIIVQVLQHISSLVKRSLFDEADGNPNKCNHDTNRQKNAEEDKSAKKQRKTSVENQDMSVCSKRIHKIPRTKTGLKLLKCMCEFAMAGRTENGSEQETLIFEALSSNLSVPFVLKEMTTV